GHAQALRPAAGLAVRAGPPGGAGPPPIQIWSSVNADRILREHEQIKKWLEAIGVKVEFRYLTDWPGFIKALGEARYPAFLYAWYAEVPDPDNFRFKLFYSDSPRNFFEYKNPLVDDLLL